MREPGSALRSVMGAFVMGMAPGRARAAVKLKQVMREAREMDFIVVFKLQRLMLNLEKILSKSAWSILL